MEPFIGQITMFGGTFAPRSWAFCDGQLLAIAQNSALFSLLGTTYGGDGRTTFGLPDLRSRFPLHIGSGNPPGLTTYSLGQKGGAASHTLTVAQIPAHDHVVAPKCKAEDADTDDPDGKFPAVANDNVYAGTADSTMAPTTSSRVGGGQGFGIQNPFQGINFLIAISGVFPSRN